MNQNDKQKDEHLVINICICHDNNYLDTKLLLNYTSTRNQRINYSYDFVNNIIRMTNKYNFYEYLLENVMIQLSFNWVIILV